MTDRKKPLLILLILIIGVICYASSLSNDFIWDDDNFIVKNKSFQSAENPATFFSDNSLFCEIEEYQHSIYRPIRTIVFWTSFKVFGLNPVPLHIFSLLIHLFNAILIFFILRKLLQCDYSAFFSSLVFAVHPGISEAVFSINYLSDPLFTSFILLAFLLLIQKSYSWQRILAISCIFILALFSKESALSFLFISGIFLLFFTEKIRFISP